MLSVYWKSTEYQNVDRKQDTLPFYLSVYFYLRNKVSFVCIYGRNTSFAFEKSLESQPLDFLPPMEYI
jgi:hypothetical protein